MFNALGQTIPCPFTEPVVFDREDEVECDVCNKLPPSDEFGRFPDPVGGCFGPRCFCGGAWEL